MEYFNAFLPLLLHITFFIGISVFFSKKIEKNANETTPDTSRPMNSLTLTRGFEYVNYTRKYKVFINGAKVKEISSGETWHIPLDPGKHTICLKIDWCKTKSFLFEKIEAANTELVCGASYNDWKANFMAFLKPSKWLYVKFV
jgi:hypothetical protein